MKKKLLILMAAFLLPILILTMVGCHSTSKIDKFGKKVIEGKNYEVEMTMSIPYYKTTIDMTVKMDGNKCYVSEFMGDPAQFFEISGSQKIVYTRTSKGWEKTTEALDGNDSFYDVSQMEQLFCGDNYEYSKEKKGYVLKDNAPIYLGMTSMVMVIKGKTCTITGNIQREENDVPISASVTIKIYNVGKTKVELPSV